MIIKRFMGMLCLLATVCAIYSFAWLSSMAKENYVSPECYKCMAQSIVEDSINK